MKTFYLTGSIVFTVLILIIAFENIGAQCSYVNILFYEVPFGPTFLFLLIAIIGIITGAMYHAFLTRLFAGSDEEENETF